MLSLHNVAFRWPGQPAPGLRIDAFQLEAGAQVFVSGASGSGKSTLLSLVAGIVVPQQGEIAVDGTALHTLGGARRDRFRADHLGVIFQQLNLLPYLSVIDNVLLACRFSKARRQRTADQGASPEDAAMMLLSRLGLDRSLWTQAAARLSVGQQQRVAAARALLGRPKLVLADEPTSALDAGNQIAFMDLLQRECGAAGASLLFVSHDDRLAARFGQRFAIPMPNPATALAP